MPLLGEFPGAGKLLKINYGINGTWCAKHIKAIYIKLAYQILSFTSRSSPAWIWQPMFASIKVQNRSLQDFLPQSATVKNQIRKITVFLVRHFFLLKSEPLNPSTQQLTGIRCSQSPYGPPVDPAKPWRETFYTKYLLQQTPFYTRHVLLQTTFTTNNFYTRRPLHQKPFTPDTFYTRPPYYTVLLRPTEQLRHKNATSCRTRPVSTVPSCFMQKGVLRFPRNKTPNQPYWWRPAPWKDNSCGITRSFDGYSVSHSLETCLVDHLLHQGRKKHPTLLRQQLSPILLEMWIRITEKVHTAEDQIKSNQLTPIK